MKKCLVVFAAFAMLSAVAVAQQTDQPQRGRGGRGGQGGPGGPGGFGGPGRGMSLTGMIDRLDEQLVFDDDQRVKIDAIVAKYEQDNTSGRELWEEMRKARESGDDARVEELREQMRNQRGQFGEQMQKMMDEIEPILYEDQRVKFQEFRQRFQQMRDNMRNGTDWRQVMRDLPDAVEMTDEQRAAYQELLQQRREAMRERFQQGRQQGGPPQGERPDPNAMMDDFFTQVAELLTEDQVALLNDYRAKIGSQQGESRGGGQEASDVRTVISAVRRVRGLTSDQQDAIREIERDASQQARTLRRADKDAQTQLATDTKAKIVKVLTAEQAEQYEQALARLSRDSGGQRERASDRRGGNRQRRNADPNEP